MPRICGGEEDEAQAPVALPSRSGRGPRERGSSSSSSDGRVDPTREVTAAVIEFLQYHGYDATLEAFSTERKNLKKAGSSGAHASREESSKRSAARIVEAFAAGSGEEFFSLWERSLPPHLLSRDLDTAKLEFYLQIYFCVFPFLPAAKSSNARGSREDVPGRMRFFREFLETRGADLAQTGEFLPYYALPYVDTPRGHPSFKPLLRSSWAKELRKQLEVFLRTVPLSSAKPRLYGWLAATRGGGSGGHRRERSHHHHHQPGEAAEAHGREAPARPSRSHEAPAGGIMSLVRRPPPGEEGDGGPVGPLGDTLSALPGVLKHSLRLEEAAGEGVPEMRSAFLQAILPPLDYGRVAADLEGGPNALVAGLLQALRWRITKSPAGNDRLRVVMTFAEQDVLRCSSSSSARGGEPLFEALADRTDGPVAEELARLTSCMASTAAGRAYLLQPGSGVVRTLAQLLTAIPSMDTLNAPMILAHEGVGNIASDSLLQQHALGALQKLSLLRRAQTEMIGLGVVPQLVSLLEGELESLSEYTVEYGMALLMNLSLRSAGKRSCEECDVLLLLEALIESSNPQVRTYANGMLYSVLHQERIRNAARERGLGDFLQMVAASSEEVFARQIRYIQRQLDSEAPERSGPESGDEEEFEDIDEEGEDVDGDEADEYEAAETLLAKGTLRGEELLCHSYLADVASAEKEEAKMRESMDVALATMNMAKHMQSGTLGASMRHSAVFAALDGEVLQHPATPFSFNASIRSRNAQEPLPDRATTSHVQRQQPPHGSRHRRTSSSSAVATRDGRGKAWDATKERHTRGSEGRSSRAPQGSSASARISSREGGMGRRPSGSGGGGSSSSSSSSRRFSGTDTLTRAEHEASALRAKMAAGAKRDDPGGFHVAQHRPTSEEYVQAFGKGRQIPRTPASGSGRK